MLGGNEYAWDGKGPYFESDQDFFFFETGNIPLQIKLLANSLPAHLLAA